MRKWFTAAVCVFAALCFTASAALAGEITGSGKGGPNGDGTPGGTLNASSVCAFSGLEDGAATPSTVQNYGHRADDPFFGTVVTQKGASSLTLFIHPWRATRGDTCDDRLQSARRPRGVSGLRLTI